jgi:hypothetical protein
MWGYHIARGKKVYRFDTRLGMDAFVVFLNPNLDPDNDL